MEHASELSIADLKACLDGRLATDRMRDCKWPRRVHHQGYHEPPQLREKLHSEREAFK